MPVIAPGCRAGDGPISTVGALSVSRSRSPAVSTGFAVAFRGACVAVDFSTFGVFVGFEGFFFAIALLLKPARRRIGRGAMFHSSRQIILSPSHPPFFV
jgi:hypothetical protein